MNEQERVETLTFPEIYTIKTGFLLVALCPAARPFLLEGFPVSFHSTTVALPLGGRMIVRHTITSAAAQVSAVQPPWFTDEVVHLQDAPAGKAIRLHTGGQGGNMHAVLPFQSASGQMLAAVYSLKQQRLTIGVCGSRRNRQAAFEPWVVRQGASLAVKYAHGVSPYYTSPVDGMDQLVHPAVLVILRAHITMHRLLVQFPADLRQAILRRLQVSSDDTPTRIEGLRLLARCLETQGPDAVWDMIEAVESTAAERMESSPTTPMPMRLLESRTTMEMQLDRRPVSIDPHEPPTPVEAQTVAGDLPPGEGLGRDTAHGTIPMPLPGSRRAAAVMGSGLAAQ